MNWRFTIVALNDSRCISTSGPSSILLILFSCLLPIHLFCYVLSVSTFSSFACCGLFVLVHSPPTCWLNFLPLFWNVLLRILAIIYKMAAIFPSISYFFGVFSMVSSLGCSIPSIVSLFFFMIIAHFQSQIANELESEIQKNSPKNKRPFDIQVIRVW